MYIFVAVLSLMLSSKEIVSKSDQQRLKRFTLFSMVQFPNSACTLASSTESNVLTGTCYTASECASQGGRASGNCALGFGVCCTFSVSECGSTITKNCTYIQNPGFPSGFLENTVCAYTFEGNSDICQIRLDLDTLVLAAPSTADADVGVCSVDTFKVISASSNGVTFVNVPPVICGTVSGSHMYFETGRETNAGTMTISTGLKVVAGLARSWKIKSTLIECGNPGKAPTDCTQYFTSLSGSFQSFNWNNGIEKTIEKQNYVVCFRQALGYCNLGFSQNPTLPVTLFLDVNTSLANKLGFVAKHTCAEAGILIPSASDKFLANIDKQESFCGFFINDYNGQLVGGVSYATVLPWNIGVYSQTGPVLKLGTNMRFESVGFNLMFMQIPCA